MALSISQTRAVEQLLKPGMKVASFGYPDIIAKIDMEGLEYRSDSDQICKRHGMEPRLIPDAHSYFKLKGCELDVFDIINERGCEIYCDLNIPNGTPWTYDIILDVGTSEHCFNIGQALMNMAGMVKEGGYIIHENPANWGNHGFYNLNPTLFADFYGQNGFKVEELKLVSRDGRSGDVPPTRRFRFMNEEVNVFCVAQRIHEQVLTYPIQTKYKGLTAAGASGDSTPEKRAIGVVNG